MQGGPWPTVFALAPKERWAKARPTVLGFIAASLCQRRLRLRRSGSLSCEPVDKHVVGFDRTEIAGVALWSRRGALVVGENLRPADARA